MYILLVAHGYPTQGDPQWGCFEKDQAEVLSRLGHKVVIAAIDGRVKTYKLPLGLRHYQDGQISAYIHRFLPTRLLISKTLERCYRERAFLWFFERIVQREGMPDVLYAHYMFCMAQLRLVKQRYQIPILGLEHWSQLNKPSLPVYLQTLGRYAYSSIDQLMAVSPILQNQIKKHFNEDCGVLYDMVNDIFLQQPLKKKQTGSLFRFISVGSLILHKGFDLLIKALARMECKQVEVFVVGDGADRDKFKSLASSEGLAGRVRFYGRISKPEIINLMQECNAFCLPSRGETFGVAHVEAMAMGLPVVTTACGGPEYFVNDDNGILVPIDDVEALAKAMDQMVNNINTYNPLEIREYIRSRFSGDVIAQQVVENLKRIINI